MLVIGSPYKRNRVRPWGKWKSSMGIVPDEFRNFRCVSNQSSSGRGIYLYVCIYIYIAEIHPLAFVSCGFSSIFPFRYRNDLSLTWTSIFVQSLHFSFTTTLHRPFPNGFHLTVSGRRGQLASRREQAHHRREKREARGNCKRPRGVKQKRIGIKGLLFLTRCVSKTRGERFVEAMGAITFFLASILLAPFLRKAALRVGRTEPTR